MIRLKDMLYNLSDSQGRRLKEPFSLQKTFRQYTSGNNVYLCYTVHTQRTVSLHVQGKAKACGMTRKRIVGHQAELVREQELIKDPAVTAGFLKPGVSVLGEVNILGRIRTDRDNMAILDA